MMPAASRSPDWSRYVPTLDELIAALPTDIEADVTTGHVSHSMIYKQIFE